jgi:endothelin-converting enzyme
MAYRRYLQRNHLSSTRNNRQKRLPDVNLTDEQLFFVGFAQTWCTRVTRRATEMAVAVDRHTYSKYRVIGSLSNMQEFAHAFDCLPGSLMNRQQRCEIWV